MLNVESSVASMDVLNKYKARCKSYIEGYLKEKLYTQEFYLQALEVLCYLLIERKLPDSIPANANLNGILQLLLEGKIERFITLSIAKVTYEILKLHAEKINWKLVRNAGRFSDKVASLYFQLIVNSKTKNPQMEYSCLALVPEQSPYRDGWKQVNDNSEQKQKEEELKKKNNLLYAKIHSQFLKINLPIIELKEEKNQWTDEIAIILAEGLRTNTHVTQLTINNCWGSVLTDVGVLALISVLAKNPVTKLHLVHIGMTDSGARGVYEYFKTTTSLEHLDVSRNFISDNGISCLSRLLLRGTLQTFKYSPDFAYRNLDEFGIHARGAIELARAVAYCRALDCLNLTNNRIRYEGAKYFAEALKLNKTLRKLILFFNPLEDKGGECIAKAMTYNNTLEKLSLEETGIGNLTAQALGYALANNLNSSLKSLDLRTNDIADVGVTALADGLKKNTSLTHLLLETNLISDEGAQALETVLMSNTTLRTLWLGNNQIKDEKIIRIKLLIKRNKLLTKYPGYANIIKEVCAREGFYKSTFPTNNTEVEDSADQSAAIKKQKTTQAKSDNKQPVSLLNLTGLLIVQQWQAFETAAEQSLPKDIFKFFKKITEFKQKLIKAKINPPEEKENSCCVI